MDGKSSIFFSIHVLHLNIYLGAVKSRFIFRLFEFGTALFHQVAEQIFARIPARIVFVILFHVRAVAEREAIAIVGIESEAEHRRDIFNKIQRLADLVDCLLFGGADDMGIG